MQLVQEILQHIFIHSSSWCSRLQERGRSSTSTVETILQTYVSCLHPGKVCLGPEGATQVTSVTIVSLTYRKVGEECSLCTDPTDRVIFWTLRRCVICDQRFSAGRCRYRASRTLASVFALRFRRNLVPGTLNSLNTLSRNPLDGLHVCA